MLSMPRGQAFRAEMSARYLEITLRVNGEPLAARVEARKTLVDFLREDLALTGSHVGCEHGVCGACTVLLERRGRARLSDACGAMRRRGRWKPSRACRIPARSPICRRAFERAQRAAMRLLHARHVISARRFAGSGGVPSATRSANISPAIIAAAPAIRPSSMRSKRWRKRARGAKNENHPRLPARAQRARPAEFLHRPLGAAAEFAAADARARAICQRRHAAAHGACGLRALAACARTHQTRSRPRRRKKRPA